ncbi:MAG: hypothetical protein WB870_04235, partial [Gallionellaceae bacterium]
SHNDRSRPPVQTQTPLDSRTPAQTQTPLDNAAYRHDKYFFKSLRKYPCKIVQTLNEQIGKNNMPSGCQDITATLA